MPTSHAAWRNGWSAISHERPGPRVSLPRISATEPRGFGFQILPVCAAYREARSRALIRPGIDAKRSSLVRPS
jgi:hypothetical protein